MRQAWYWAFNLACGLFAGAAVNNRLFGYLTLVFVLICVLVTIGSIQMKSLDLNAALKGAFLSAVLMWVPFYFFAIDPRLQYNSLAWPILATCVLAGALGVLLCSPLIYDGKTPASP